MKLKAKAKKTWLKEVGKWLRTVGSAPAMLFLIVWSGNAVLALMGRPAAFKTLEDISQANWPSVLLAGGAYVIFNAIATWAEIKAEEIEDDPEPPSLILPPSHGWDRRKGPGGNST